MNVHDSIQSVTNMAYFILNLYLKDLSNEELMKRPASASNHLAWQLGHLITSQQHALESLLPTSVVPLPENFAASYTKQMVNVDDPAKFHSKDLYLKIFESQRTQLFEALSKFSESDLDAPGPEGMRSYAPTMGAVFLLHGSHMMLHLGQFAVARRALGKAIVM